MAIEEANEPPEAPNHNVGDSKFSPTDSIESRIAVPGSLSGSLPVTVEHTSSHAGFRPSYFSAFRSRQTLTYLFSLFFSFFL